MTAVSVRPLSLAADTAADLMSPDPPALASGATFGEALAALIDHNANVVPVVDDRGEPVGVLGLTDLLIHVRESNPDGARVAPATAAELMTPTVFAVDADTPAAAVVADMVRARCHHLFVTDRAGKIVGVVSACDVLRHLQ